MTCVNEITAVTEYHAYYRLDEQGDGDVKLYRKLGIYDVCVLVFAVESSEGKQLLGFLYESLDDCKP